MCICQFHYLPSHLKPTHCNQTPLHLVFFPPYFFLGFFVNSLNNVTFEFLPFPAYNFQSHFHLPSVLSFSGTQLYCSFHNGASNKINSKFRAKRSNHPMSSSKVMIVTSLGPISGIGDGYVCFGTRVLPWNH